MEVGPRPGMVGTKPRQEMGAKTLEVAKEANGHERPDKKRDRALGVITLVGTIAQA